MAEEKYFKFAEKFDFDKTTVLDYIEEFKKFDENGDGDIESNELGKIMKNLGSESTDEELKKFVNEVDLNKDGVIDFGEFLQIMKRINEGEGAGRFGEVVEEKQMHDSYSSGFFKSDGEAVGKE